MSQELWYRLAHDKYPSLSVHQVRDLKLEAAMDYTFANNSDLGQLYEQYVIMRTLSSPRIESK